MHLSRALLCASLLSTTAYGEVTFHWIDEIGVGAFDVSNDGVVTGNWLTTESAETIRWTVEDGLTNLGRDTGAAFGLAAGTPNISDDGTRISATIVSSDNWMIGAIWEDGVWTETLPLPPDGGRLDFSYSSAWGLSGDGQMLVGLYWRPGQPGGDAHAFKFDEVNGGASVGGDPNAESSRANGANYDGSVVGGWERAPFGTWLPTVWVNGVKTILEPDTLVNCEVEAVSGDGLVAAGNYYDPALQTRIAVRWVFDGADWNRDVLGYLPGTALGLGHVWVEDVNHDGTLCVGYNRFVDNGPFSIGTGFLWTPELGMTDVLDFLADNGVDFESETYDVLALTGVSADGSAICGIARENSGGFGYRSFLIRVLPDCPWDLDGDGSVGSGDLALIIGFWGQTDVPGDFNGDGVGSDDLAELIGNWGPCP